MCDCFTTKLRASHNLLYRLVVTVITASLFVGSLRGDKVTMLSQNVTTTKDVYNRNNNFRSKISSYGEKNYDRNENLRDLGDEFSNNHRKSVFLRRFIDESAGYSSSWAIRLPPHLHKEGLDIVRNIADQLKLSLHGSIGHLKGHYLLVHDSFYNPSQHTNGTLKQEIHRVVNEKLKYHPHVEWFEHEKLLRRKRRSLEFKDEFFPSQWHLVSCYMSCLSFSLPFLSLLTKMIK